MLRSRKQMTPPLIKRLRKLPELLSLQNFAEQLTILLKDLQSRPPSSLMEHMDNIQETHDLWLPHPDEPVSLRTLRHVIYQHDCIKKNLSKEGKEIMLNHQIRIKILLSRRLSHLRLGKEVRDQIISNKITEELEILLGQTNNQLKNGLVSKLANVSDSSIPDSSRHETLAVFENAPTYPNDLRASAQTYTQHYRAALGHPNVSLEWQNNTLPITHPRDIQQSTEILLEILFEIERNSPLSQKISNQIKQHVAKNLKNHLNL